MSKSVIMSFGLKFQCVNTYVTSLIRWREHMMEWCWLCPHQSATPMGLLKQHSVERKMVTNSVGVWIRLDLRYQAQGKTFACTCLRWVLLFQNWC